MIPVIAFLILLSWQQPMPVSGDDLASALQSLEHSLLSVIEQMARKDDDVAALARHVMLNRFQDEERVRAEGQSGIENVRNYAGDHTDTYSYTGDSFGAIHDHVNIKSCLGVGEMTAVLNGVQFRISHGDYQLQRPSTTSDKFHEMEPISLPPVPESVQKKKTIEEQVAEMREYFRAFQESNSTIKEYQPYFKPVLCYLEGAWLTDSQPLTSSTNARYSYKAFNWEHMADISRTEAHTGSQGPNSFRVAQLPTTIMGLDAQTKLPVYGHWSYRFVCNPLQQHLLVSAFKLVDNVAYRQARAISYKDYFHTKGAHFELDDGKVLDDIMSTIPGKNNLAEEMPIYEKEFFGPKSRANTKTKKELNMAFYNRQFSLLEKWADAMSKREFLRGFADQSLWIAFTNQSQVAPLLIERCQRGTSSCVFVEGPRVSVAIPFEVVYLTPLHTWNPHNLRSHDYKYMTAKGNGTKESPYNGTSDIYFYMTPSEMFSSVNPPDRVKADAYKSMIFTRDQRGEVASVRPAGVWTVTPPIKGLGPVRTRFPIAPVHAHGSSVWKELNSFQHYLKDEMESLADVLEGAKN